MEGLNGVRIAIALIGAAAAGAASLLLGSTEAAATLAAVLGGVTAFLALDGGMLGARAEAGPADPPQPDPHDAPGIAEVIESIDDPVLLVSRQTVALANTAALRTLGDHIAGEDVRLAIRHPAAADRLIGDDADKGVTVTELTGLGDRNRRWEMRVHPLGDGDRLVRLVDRTQTYAAERMRVDFVANASHELRTPLATLIGFIETLEEAGDEPATRARFLKIMAGEARRMQQLVLDLMSLSRIEADRYSVPQDAVSLEALIAEARDSLSAGVADEKSRIEIMMKPETPFVLGDRAQLSQLLHNLIGNALKYGRPGGPVRVRIGPAANGQVRLIVEDEGDGIAPEHLPRLTERFYRADPSRSRAAGGTGLGLAIVKHIVERHRGRLDIRSTVGTGTTVSVLLPAAPAAMSSNCHASVTESDANGPRGVTHSA